MSTMEANELVMESYGYELLQAVGATYAARGRQYNLTNSSAFGGVIGWGLGFKVRQLSLRLSIWDVSQILPAVSEQARSRAHSGPSSCLDKLSVWNGYFLRQHLACPSRSSPQECLPKAPGSSLPPSPLSLNGRMLARECRLNSAIAACRNRMPRNSDLRLNR
jgi:hypothetical protein